MILNIQFGAMVPSIQSQLLKAGVKMPGTPTMRRLQKDADSISHLAVRGLLSDAERAKARRRLMKKILKAVQ